MQSFLMCACVTWPPYLGGVMQHHCSAQDLDHAVVIVGYSLQGIKCLTPEVGGASDAKPVMQGCC